MDFFSQYLEYTKDTESPRIYHRWCAITSVGAMLGRNIYLRHGHSNIYPNLYCMLIGTPGSRKSTAIKLTRKLISIAGYRTFAADKSSKEKFLVDLATDNSDDIILNGSANSASKPRYDDITAANLWGASGETDAMGKRIPKEVFISADEFNEFAGAGNHELFTTLGNLWDWDDETRGFTQRFKSGSIDIYQPTINLLGGNTQENFARAFPPEIIGQGFLSRLILIYGQRTGRKIPFPTIPPETATEKLVTYIAGIRKFYESKNGGGGSKEIKLSVLAAEIFSDIYNEWTDIPDVRFNHYNTRRSTHLLKLSLLLTGAALDAEISPETIIYANTILSAAELLMPEALGEFGKGKNSDISNRVMKLIEEARAPVDIHAIWKHVRTDLNEIKDLGSIIQSLEHAGSIQLVKGKGFLPKKAVRKVQKYVDWNLLSEEEREGLI